MEEEYFVQSNCEAEKNDEEMQDKNISLIKSKKKKVKKNIITVLTNIEKESSINLDDKASNYNSCTIDNEQKRPLEDYFDQDDCTPKQKRKKKKDKHTELGKISKEKKKQKKLVEDAEVESTVENNKNYCKELSQKVDISKNKIRKLNKNESMFYIKIDNNLNENKQQKGIPQYRDFIYNIIVPLKEKGRLFTISIAIPSSILEETCQLDQLRTFVIGQIARAACIYSVDEIIVYNDNCWASNDEKNIEHLTGMMKMILQYQECPQYLRKKFFGFHPYTARVGVLNALNAPHHLRFREWCDYRDGITVEDESSSKSTLVDVGLKNMVTVPTKIVGGVRVTVKFSEESKTLGCTYGTVVSPSEPRTKGGLYWGYSVRTADSLSEALKPEDNQDEYDLIIGTSERGNYVENIEFKSFKRALIVFGGVQGLEEAISRDEDIKDCDSSQLFHHYVNTCPNQTSRTIRTEEAILISLSSLQSKLFDQSGNKK